MKKLIFLFLLVTGFAFGLSFNETDLNSSVTLEITRHETGEVVFFVKGTTITSDGTKIRTIQHNIWDSLNTTQQSQVNQLINAAINRAKTIESIS